MWWCRSRVRFREGRGFVVGCARGARRDGFEGAEEMASSENPLPMDGGCRKASCSFLFARGGRLLSPPPTSYAAVAKSMG